MRVQQHEAVNVLTTAVLVVVVGLVGLAGAIRLAENAADIGPTLGEIVNFEPNQRTHDSMPLLTVTRPGQPVCIVDIGTLRRLGGSLVIEARTPAPDRSFTVHWAGEHSSLGPNDCGPSAQLVLSEDDLEILAAAAGGFGIHHLQLHASNQWRGGVRSQPPSRSSGGR